MARFRETLQIGTSAFDPGKLLQAFLINLLLLLGVGLFSRGQWAPALVVLSVYVVTLVVNTQGGPLHQNPIEVRNLEVNHR